MKYAFFLSGALALAASSAHAEYVCEVNLVSPGANPADGKSGEIVLVTSALQNCGGPTKQSLICSKDSTDAACGLHAQYSDLGLTTLYTAIHAAQMEQQQAWVQTDVCNGAGNSWACQSGVVFHGR